MTSFSGVSLDLLREMLIQFDEAPVEGAGCTRLIHTFLCEAGINHKAYAGSVKVADKVICPHFWIEVLEDLANCHWKIDYRLRMWFGDKPTIPHGIFEKTPEVTYIGQKIDMPILDEATYNILLLNIDVNLPPP